MEILVIQKRQENSIVKYNFYSISQKLEQIFLFCTARKWPRNIACWQIKQYVSMIFEKYLIRAEIFTQYKIHYGKEMQESIIVSRKVHSPSTQHNSIF